MNSFHRDIHFLLSLLRTQIGGQCNATMPSKMAVDMAANFLQERLGDPPTKAEIPLALLNPTRLIDLVLILSFFSIKVGYYNLLYFSLK